jgi:hypothetical protein
MLTHSELANAIEPHAPRLSQRALERSYEDPFWLLRFGERGLRYTREDGDFHVKYVCQALRSEEPELLARYGAWLRTLLVSRGMCSRHLADHFRYLGEALREMLPGSEAASSYLEAAARSLDYADGVAGALSSRAERVASRVVRELGAPNARLSREVLAAASYLADAHASNKPEIFTAYLRVLRSSEAFALGPRVEELLCGMARAVVAELEEPAAASALAFIDQARRGSAVA